MEKVPYPHPYIAREGWPFIAFIGVVSLVVTFFNPLVSIIFWLMTLFTVQFFRDPPRSAGSDNPLDVLSPADGRVVVVQEAEDPFRQRQALKISVFMNVFNVHSNRAPLAGNVQSVAYFAGSFLNAAVDKASTENERCAVLLQTENQQEITFVQIAGLVAKRILCYAKIGSTLTRGERYGFIRFGSRVDVYLPLGSQAKVAIGDKVSATSSVLAQLPEEYTQIESH